LIIYALSLATGRRGCIKNPTTVFQPWVLVETQSLSTSADGGVNQDDGQNDLSVIS
jgi:hypothetical protein